MTATSGSYLLAPMEQPSAGAVQSLRIPRPTGDFYYLEFRQPFGFDTYAATSAVVNGVSVRVSGDYTTDMKSYLLDMTPATTWTVVLLSIAGAVGAAPSPRRGSSGP